ncbi:hypothetical protein RHS01_05204 [Rhizoctonia solani]|uniref:Uncharacterized protein n=1 Tax=Rhizoctonia solani TaxID=456999 RepID=A0A8H7IDU5_9AGAM|nr:hypothetical protein RHS01_05204 [Rhizoctonia solani]
MAVCQSSISTKSERQILLHHVPQLSIQVYPQTPSKNPRRRANTTQGGHVDVISLGIGALSLSPSKALGPNDSLNPFLEPSSKPRAPSPTRVRSKHGRSNTLSAAVGARAIGITDALANEARQGILHKGGLESKYDSINITRDWPVSRGKTTETRTGSVSSRPKASHAPISAQTIALSRPVLLVTLQSETLMYPQFAAAQATSNTATVSPGHAARLTASLALPSARSAFLRIARRLHYQPRLHTSAPTLPGSIFAYTPRTRIRSWRRIRPTSRRKISDKPERILDAPDLWTTFT